MIELNGGKITYKNKLSYIKDVFKNVKSLYIIIIYFKRDFLVSKRRNME